MKVITGGQTGIDQWALLEARHWNIQVGGYLPKGGMTETGPFEDPEEYGLVIVDYASYAERTKLNVAASDLVVWIGNPTTNGFKCTARNAKAMQKPFVQIQLLRGLGVLEDLLLHEQPERVMVAGHRESGMSNPEHFRMLVQGALGLIAAYNRGVGVFA